MSQPPMRSAMRSVARSASSSVPADGDTIGGKYRVVRVLGEGGMARVHESVHLRTGARVAVKILSDEAKAESECRVRFAREARAMGRLHSRHTVRVLDVDELDDGTPYMVMELLDGVDLARELTKRGPLPVADAASILVQVAAGVAEAHTAGVVHRDLKPANVFLATERGVRVAKVLDFGISKLARDDQDVEEVTRTLATIGTPAYMSPEQIRAPRDVDEATDVWAMGVMLHRMLAGRVPFTGNPSSVAVSICNDAAPSLRALRPEVPEELAVVVARALEKDKRARPTVAELAEIVARHVDGSEMAEPARAALHELRETVGVLPQRAATDGASLVRAGALSSATPANDPSELAAAPTRGKPLRARAIVLVGVALVVLVFGLFFRRFHAVRAPVPAALLPPSASSPPLSGATGATGASAMPSSAAPGDAVAVASNSPSAAPSNKPLPHAALPPKKTSKPPPSLDPNGVLPRF